MVITGVQMCDQLAKKYEHMCASNLYMTFSLYKDGLEYSQRNFVSVSILIVIYSDVKNYIAYFGKEGADHNNFSTSLFR